MSTKQKPIEKDSKKEPKKSDKQAELEAMQNAPQSQPEYKPDANTITDNRRSDYDQPNLVNPESQAIKTGENQDKVPEKPIEED